MAVRDGFTFFSLYTILNALDVQLLNCWPKLDCMREKLIPQGFIENHRLPQCISVESYWLHSLLGQLSPKTHF